MFLYGCTKKIKTYQLGILYDGIGFNEMSNGFKTKMTELGYIENNNIFYNMQNGDGDPDKGEQLAKKLVADKVDLILTIATPSTMAAYKAIKGTNIPLVFVYIDTENTTIINNVREPGGNITGIRYPGPELQAKRLEILLEIAPQIKRVWIGYDINNPSNKPTLKMLRQIASKLDVALLEVPSINFNVIKSDLSKREKLKNPGIDAIILMPDRFNHMPENFKVISQFANKHKIPFAGSFLYTVERGAIFGNANDFNKVGELAAPIVDKILKGIPAGSIPVITPEEYLIINFKKAQELGLTIPEGLLNQAEEIIR